ncbi:MAG: nitronate monooxygenase, partial [Deltaproteobacteria bacterium]|nr:nitronate monooxygenase [Deltaproteobacteria bacterium]
MGKRFTTKITDMLGIEHPILCGGMQWISRSDFVAEVCNAGGMGFITAESFETAQDLREDIRKIRTLTDKPFGVNISMLPEVGSIQARTLQFCDVVCEEGVTVVETAGRSPEPIMPKFKEAGVKVIHKL